MRDRSFWSVSGLAAAASIVLASCGGDFLAAVAFIGSAGGDWQVDGNAQPGLQPLIDCGPAPKVACTINISAVGGQQDLFATAFDVTYDGNMPGCAAVAGRLGRIEGKRINLSACFVGEYVTPNEALSDGGSIRAFFDFRPDLEPGVWVEVQKGQRRFKFSDNSAGCEYSAATRPPVTVSIVNSQVLNVAGLFETTIGSLTIDGGAAYSGTFVGVSGMSLRRGNEVLELERRNEVPSTPCP
jgi:hypothetical protein